MAFGWSRTRCSPIAVDFGADSLKLLQIVPADPPQLLAAASVEMPEETRPDPGLRQAFAAGALKKLLRSAPFKGRKAVCAIPAYQTLVQQLQIARVEHEDFDAQVGLHLRQRLNVDPSRMVIRNFPVNLPARPGASKQEVICMAVSKESVMRHIETLNRAGLDVVGMHSEPVAIMRAFAHLFRRDVEEARTLCFVDIGGATTKVVIAQGPEMVFAKAIHAAGDHLTRHRAKAEQMSFAEARRTRMLETGAAAGKPAANADRPAAVDAIDAAIATIDAALDQPSPCGSGFALLDAQLQAQHGAAETGAGDTLDCLIDELQLCVRYHQSLFPDRPIEKLVFVGGESRHVSTCQRIARAVRIGAQLGDPMAQVARVTQAAAPVGVDFKQPQPGWSVPLGLCLSEPAS